MAKKKFSEGLHDLFSDSAAEANSTVFAPAERPAQERKVSGKNFMTDLDALLQEALEETMERYEANQPDSITASSAKTRQASGGLSVGLSTGLDALIRQTVDFQEINTDEANGKKRLTVTVDRSKLDKLKAIARLENAYLKDLLIEVIDGYINEYVHKKGLSV
jgi:hypothetical protein